MKEKVCVNCESVKVPNEKSKGSWILCLFIWLFTIIMGVICSPLIILAPPIYFGFAIVMTIFSFGYLIYLVGGEKIYSCPVCGAANPLPPKSAKGLEVLSKLQVKGDEDAIRIIGFIREEEKAKNKAGF
jgi:hypothetical protein